MSLDSDVVPFADGTKVLHIGLPKTGTTAVQGALHTDRLALAEHGLAYAGHRRHSHKAATAAAVGNEAWFRKDETRVWKRIADEVRTSPARVTVFSSEALSRADRDHARAIVDSVGGEAQVVLTVRALPSILPSVWQQGVRANWTAPFPEFVDDLLSDKPVTPNGRVLRRRFSIDRYLDIWGSVVGPENLTYVVVDVNDRSMLLHTFEKLLALPAGVLSVPNDLINQSLPYPESELLRRFNAIHEQTIEPGTIRNNLAGPIHSSKLRELRTPLEPHRIEVSRAHAEACNALGASWIEAIRGSGARVIGSLEHLLVDPMAYPGPTPALPQTVSLDSAAELAGMIHDAGLKAGQEAPRTPKPAKPAKKKPKPVDPPAAMAQVPTSALARELRSRIVRKLRPGR